MHLTLIFNAPYYLQWHIYISHLTPCFDRIACVQVKVLDCLARELYWTGSNSGVVKDSYLICVTNLNWPVRFWRVCQKMTLKAIIGDKVIEASCSLKKGNFEEKKHSKPLPSPLHSNSPDRSPWISLQNKLREFDKTEIKAVFLWWSF